MVDPRRAFGAPIVVRGAVPTRILAQTARVEDSIQQTTEWYEVEAQEVQDVLDYEELLAA